jgi:hypothetical protein
MRVSFGCDTLKSGNCLNALYIIKKEPYQNYLFFYIISLNCNHIFIFAASSFFMICYARVFHGFNVLYLKRLYFQKALALRHLQFCNNK